MSSPGTPDFEAIKVKQQATWASGDYALVGGLLVIVAETLCEALDLRPGQRVLDVATGSGNIALAAARRFCDVTGVDYVPDLLGRARERAKAERLSIEFEEGDAEALKYKDGAFDVVVSTFGAMFAPNQERVAAELTRVCAPGGKIGMANWTPESYIGQLFKLTGTFVPPPAGLKGPTLWGSEARVRELFGDRVSNLQFEKRKYTFRFPSADHWLGYFKSYYGPTMKAFEALDAERQVEYSAAILDLIGRFNRSGDNTMIVESEYLEVVATRA